MTIPPLPFAGQRLPLPSVPAGRARVIALVLATATVAACSEPLDVDLRRQMGGSVDTTAATVNATTERPEPDARGVISYPNYQVAIAQRDDTLTTLAGRVGLPAPELARFNGLRVDDPLRAGEVVVLPTRVAEPSPATGAATTGPIRPPGAVDVASLAASAIDGSAPTPAQPGTAPVQTGQEPIRHRVRRGETVFTIARLYNVSSRALVSWNGIDSDFTLREGQFLLIPTPQQAAQTDAIETPPTTGPAPAAAVPAPGIGSATPVPPSASAPLPADETPDQPAAQPTAPVADIGQPDATDSTGAMVQPVDGSIARAFSGERNPGVVFSAQAGAPVRAADSGSVISVSSGSDGARFVLIRHANDLLTAYRFVDSILVGQGDAVSRGQTIASVAPGDPAALDFRVYRGTTALDPSDYLR